MDSGIKSGICSFMCGGLGTTSSTALGIVAGEGLAAEGYIVEHQPVREIAVVRNRKDAPPGALLVGVHPGPEILRVVRVVAREGDEILHPRLAVTENDPAVQIVAVGCRAPFETVQRRENA